MSNIDTNTQPPQEFDDEADEGTPESHQPEQAGSTLDLTANPPAQQEGPRALTVAAQQVPVKTHGAAPENFAHQITLAQYMAKAQLMVPQHFHGNVGDCLAIIDIAQRAGLSPYMVAAKTYKDPKGKGIAFESQLYHAMLIGSGWLKDSALHVEYEGEGEARTCTVWGTLKTENEPRRYTSPPLKDLLPAKNDRGELKGSPLWRDKPDVQMFYDTSRDWSRMFAPIATLGMLAQYESIEHPIEPPTSDADALKARLKSANNTEGHSHGFAEAELAKVAADKGGIQPAGDGSQWTAEEIARMKNKKAPIVTNNKATAPKGKPTKAEQRAAAAKATAKRAADRAEATSAAKKKPTEPTKPAAPAKAKVEHKTDDPKPTIPTKPKNAAEYQVYAEDWINKAGDPEKVMARWDQERDMRNDLTVRINVRNMLRALIESKHGV